MARRLALLALLAAGCANGNDPAEDIWHGDSAFTLTERDAIEKGAAFTAGKLGASPPVIVWTGIDRAHRSIERAMPAEPGDECGAAGRHWMWIAPSCAELAPVAAHEFGHSFCLNHHTEPGIMRPGTNTLEWTEADAKETPCQ